MSVKERKEGFESLSKAVVVLNIADVGLPISPLPRNDIEVPEKLEGTFIVLLVYIYLVLEVTNELVMMMTQRNIGLENVD